MTESPDPLTTTPEVAKPAKERKPRFSLENPGDLAVLESEWLSSEKGLVVTPAQVRGVLMFHGEFQRSDVRKFQRDQAKVDRDAADAQRKADREAKKEAKKAEKAVKDAAKEAAKTAEAAATDPVASSDNAEFSNSAEAPAPAKRPSRLRNRGSKTPAAAAAEF